MHNKLINYFLKFTHLSKDEKNILIESMTIKKISKSSFLLKEGEFTDDTYFILNGLVRQFKLIDGNDITTNFFMEEQWIISLANFEDKKTSDFSLVCVEDTVVVCGNEQKAQELFKQFPRFEKISRQIMETAFLEYQTLMTSYKINKPEDRYLQLMQQRPSIFQRVPQYDIASYIGVKPESLSRIRKKLQSKKL